MPTISTTLYELCDSDIFLRGNYTIEISKEEIYFWKGEGSLKQTYHLKLLPAGK